MQHPGFLKYLDGWSRIGAFALSVQRSQPPPHRSLFSRNFTALRLQRLSGANKTIVSDLRLAVSFQ